jgi:hypothetical protein
VRRYKQLRNKIVIADWLLRASKCEDLRIKRGKNFHSFSLENKMNFVAVLFAILPLAFAAPQIAPPSIKDRAGRAPPSPIIGAPSEQRLPRP